MAVYCDHSYCRLLLSVCGDASLHFFHFNVNTERSASYGYNNFPIWWFPETFVPGIHGQWCLVVLMTIQQRRLSIQFNSSCDKKNRQKPQTGAKNSTSGETIMILSTSLFPRLFLTECLSPFCDIVATPRTKTNLGGKRQILWIYVTLVSIISKMTSLQ